MPASPQAQKSQESDVARQLREVVERLALPAEALLRREAGVTAPGFKELIDVLTRQIDETVLPRQYALISEGGQAATMTLSNRRMIALEIEGRKITTAAGKDATPDAVANSYAQALKALSTRSGPLVLRRIGRADHALAGGEACAAQHLSHYGETPCFKNRLKAFLKEIHPATQGWIFQTGESEPVAHSPDPELFERLTALGQKVRAETEARSGHRHLSRPSQTLAAFALSTEMQALVASDGTDLLTAALPLADMPAAMAHWATVFGRPKPSKKG